MWRVVRFLIAGLFTVLMAVPAGEAAAVALLPGPAAGGLLAAQPVSPTAPVTNAPSGPTLDPAQIDEENAKKSKRKMIVGIIAVLLLASVLVGRRMRGKQAKKG